MDFYEAVGRRTTVREFQARPVEPEKVRRVLEAGLKAPANAHLKDWDFVLLRDPANRRKAVADALGARDLKDKEAIEALIATMPYEELKEVYRKSLPLQLTMMLEAPEVLLVCWKPLKPLGEVGSYFELNWLASAWCCIENMLLAMAAEGLYGCTYVARWNAGLREFLGVPPDREVAAVIPFGYPRREPKPRPAPDLAPRLHIDRW
jgi:5,6-dimethylbenzimidazole synthase